MFGVFCLNPNSKYFPKTWWSTIFSIQPLNSLHTYCQFYTHLQFENKDCVTLLVCDILSCPCVDRPLRSDVRVTQDTVPLLPVFLFPLQLCSVMRAASSDRWLTSPGWVIRHSPLASCCPAVPGELSGHCSERGAPPSPRRVQLLLCPQVTGALLCWSQSDADVYIQTLTANPGTVCGEARLQVFNASFFPLLLLS